MAMKNKNDIPESDMPMPACSEIHAERILVKGIVQGVGFRPFVFRLACSLGLSGRVANTREGVEIIIQGRKIDITSFKKILGRKAPPLSRITEIKTEAWQVEDLDGFIIETSSEECSRSTIASPDAAICDSCLNEMKDNENQRAGFPFINCTDCGPRFSIIKDLPFDRKTTTMAQFPMCDKCRSEYKNPLDRRFHAQAICCPICGPKISLVKKDIPGLSGKEAMEEAVSMLKNGQILAVKGIGGFHLACDAMNEKAVSRLRDLKKRGDKPFAVMAESIDKIMEIAHVSHEEMKILDSPARPIVILKKRSNITLAESIAPASNHENNMVGLMLPYSPLHFLLLSDDLKILVMTSANLKDEPIISKNAEAVDAIGKLADAALIHDRDIHARSDDSVGRWIGDSFRLFRRSRGYVPMPVDLGEEGPDILATGGILKNTLCLAKGKSAFLSQHIGDLETPSGLSFFHEASDHMAKLFDIRPSVIVLDSHPDHIASNSTRNSQFTEVMRVQHHHAHIVSCMVENGFHWNVIGLAFDGTGYGDDGTIWGGEVLLASRDRYERMAHICNIPMPGGEAAVRQPWRMGLSWLYHTFGNEMWNLDLPFLKKIEKSGAEILVKMMDKRINSPLTSSMGRLFDAASAITGVCDINTFDGQAAMALEMCAMDQPEDLEGYRIKTGCEGSIDMKPLIRKIVMDLESGLAPSIISARFHGTLIDIFTRICSDLSEKTGIDVVSLSGGVFQNARLLSGLSKTLSEKKLKVLSHSMIPTNDGGLSLGQAGIAVARLSKIN